VRFFLIIIISFSADECDSWKVCQSVSGSDQCEEIIKTLVELVMWTSSVADGLSRQRPVGGDFQSVRQQQDAVQVSLFSSYLPLKRASQVL